MTLPRILLVSLGGTITMSTRPGAGAGVVPTLSADDLVQAVPALAQVARLEACTAQTLPGASLTIGHLGALAALLTRRLTGDDVDGAVVVQGTDTLEDTAFVLDVLLQVGKPVVVTGAMRAPAAPGADGPANLLSAVTAAADARLRDAGVVVVLNDELHAARFARKTHTALPSAFSSPGVGVIGTISEGRVRLVLRPLATLRELVFGADGGFELHALETLREVAVAQVPLGLGEDGRLLPGLHALGYEGAIIEGVGAGHVPARTVEAIGALAQQMPVVLSTRVGAGRVFEATYGFAGSERDLLARGLVAGGMLSPHKARLLLSLLLASGQDRRAITEVFGRLDQ